MTNTHDQKWDSLCSCSFRVFLLSLWGFLPTFPPFPLLFYIRRVWEELNPVMPAKHMWELSMPHSLYSVSVFLPVYWSYCSDEFYLNLIFLNYLIKFKIYPPHSVLMAPSCLFPSYCLLNQYSINTIISVTIELCFILYTTAEIAMIFPEGTT